MRTLMIIFAICLGSRQTQASPCPEILKAFRTSPFLPPTYQNLCEVSADQSKLISELTAAGFKAPLRLANVYAPRLIDRVDWEKALKQNPDVDPASIYDPAPVTWNNWERAAKAAQLNVIGANPGVQPVAITSSHLLALFQLATAHSNFNSGFRKSKFEIGRAWEKELALPIEQTEEINQIDFPVFDKSGRQVKNAKLVSWHTTQCLEDRPHSFRAQYERNSSSLSKISDWPEVKESAFTDSKGRRRRCGYLKYIDSPLVPTQIQFALEQINAPIQWWKTKQVPYDPILLASRAQRWLVAIHPFQGGNGRVSRLVMDEILMGAGLPTPLLDTMDDDLGTTESLWAKKVGEGIGRTLQSLKDCLKKPPAAGCRLT
jgi:hypothetical protein